MKNRVVIHKAYASALEWSIEDQCPWVHSAAPDDPEWDAQSAVFWTAMAIGNLDLCEAEDQEDLP